MHAILPSQPATVLALPRLAVRLLDRISQTLSRSWPLGALPVPEVSESTWADWVAEEARILAS